MRVALLSIEASSCLLASSTLREEGRPMSGRSFPWSRDALSTACGCPGSLKKFRIQLSDSCLTRCLHPVIPATIMKLRDHPLLSRYGVKSWPPTWTWIDGRANKKPKGEVLTAHDKGALLCSALSFSLFSARCGDRCIFFYSARIYLDRL